MLNVRSERSTLGSGHLLHNDGSHPPEQEIKLVFPVHYL